MCFSAQASFLASVTLVTLGVCALKKAKSKATIPLALAPFFFGIQQASEGVVWITYNNPDYAIATTIATWIFMFFAYIFWPIWTPFTVLIFEKNMHRKHILFTLLGVGITVAASLAYTLFMSGVQPQINCSHIYYDVAMAKLFGYWGPFMYCIATIVPFFVSTKKHMALLGGTLFASVAITYWFYAAFFTSVWCFFTALLSLGIILIV